MSELINNSEKRKELLKHMIMQLHEGEAPDEVRGRLVNLMTKIPYNQYSKHLQENGFEIFPNPASQFITVQYDLKKGHNFVKSSIHPNTISVWSFLPVRFP